MSPYAESWCIYCGDGSASWVAPGEASSPQDGICPTCLAEGRDRIEEEAMAAEAAQKAEQAKEDYRHAV